MWQAVVVDELVWVGGFSSRSDEMEGFLKTFGFRFPVGCQTKETGLFITQKENGIMGLGRHRSTVMSYMLNAGRVAQNLFTLCFAGDGGEIVFGGVDYGHHTSDVGYTPLLDDTSAFYPVHVKSVSVNDKRLDIDESTLNSGRGVIVDSGTTDTFFDAKGKRNFMSAFKEAAGRDYSESRMQLSEDELAALPVISIVLSGMSGNGSDDVQLDIPASKYLTPDNNGYYYGNFHFSERSGGVLGASVMVGYDVIFDMEHKRIGFADSNCGKGYANRSSNGAADTTPTNTPVATPNSSFITPIDLSGPNATIEPTGSTVEIPGSSATTTTSGPLATTTDGSNTTATVFAGTVDSTDVNKGSTLGGSTSRSSPAIGAFIAEVIIISLNGAVGIGDGRHPQEQHDDVSLTDQWRLTSDAVNYTVAATGNGRMGP
ncbi:hypothetical protein PHYBOEH_003252 [Phytophthora boehmeriae]|uniref:Peptidase A1 domain-containing protein n=1 Tax=Phytophthora boehmeriae TaxID=109152 RepID=A0A8T1X4R0_9STRA|nr:hypothetical protein PHYBOEH_003252 [Phytophthora boehmeriae]